MDPAERVNESGKEERRRARFKSLVPLLPLVPLAVSVLAITSEARHLDWGAVRAAIRELQSAQLFWASVLTAVSFAILTGYDALGLRFARQSLPYHRSAFASFVGFAVSQSLGFPLATSVPIRYRLYAAWGLTPRQIRDVLGFYLATFWISSLGLSGAVLLVEPLRLPSILHLPASTIRPLGALLVLATAAYLTWAVRRDRRFVLWRWEVRSPGPGLALAQLAIGAADWTVGAAVLYVILPAGSDVLPFPTFVGLFLLSQVAGQLSQVPGGLGVFEALILTLLPREIGTGGVLASLLVYRLVYYLLPFLLAILALGSYEAWNRRKPLERAVRGIGPIVPPAMAVAVFAAGLVLLFSGAVPAEGGRLAALERFVPLPFVEVSHFLASLVGALLLVLAWAIQRRIEVAYHLTLGLLTAGAALSLLKGLDYEEAAILTVMGLTLLASGREFYRRSSLLGEPWTAGWGAAVAGAAMAVVGLAFVAHRQPLVAGDTWWLFEWDAEAPRSVRGIVGALSLLGGLAVLKLLSPAAPRLSPPTDEDRRDASALALNSPRTYAQLVLLGDKQLLFDRSRSAFIMFAIQGRSWVAMGDPVGSDEGAKELVWDFRALAHRQADWAVFYQVAPACLPLYLDLGLTATKLGEEARVPLAGFTLEGGHRKGLRRTLRTVEKAGAAFRVLQASEIPTVLPQLRAISDGWLTRKNTREKRFSLGSFDERYLSQAPVAALELEGRVVAFANLQEGADLHEASVDLMRYSESAPPDAMEYLLTRSMLWAKERGFQWFSLGMAPLSGLDARPLAPIWPRLGAALFRHGEHFYHFEGLRAYKEGFDPVWEPRYLVSPGGVALPRVLANVATLIAGGLGGLVPH